MEKTKSPKKQRKRALTNIHALKKEMSSHLSKELKAKYSKRSIGIVVGDKVKIVSGKHKGKEGKIEKISLKKRKVFIEGIQKEKTDGTFSKIGTHPSNLIIKELELKDKKRKDKLSPKTKKGEAEK